MKNIKIYVILFIGLTVTILSCQKKKNVNPKTPETPVKKVKVPGKFGLTQMQTGQRIRKQVMDGITYVPYEKSAANQRTTNMVNFDIGKLKASKSFYFILSNIGDTSLTNITIEANNPNVEVFPKSIDKLEPTGNTGIVPLLELGIIHGDRLNGVGFQSLLPMGDNTIELTLKGKTFGEKGEEMVELKAEVKLFTEVMDVEYYMDDQKLPYKNTHGGYMTYNAMRGETFKIKNTGNVDIKLRHYFVKGGYLDSLHPAFDTTLVLPVNQTYVFPRTTAKVDSRSYFNQVTLDGAGAVVDPAHLKLSTDGIIRFFFAYSY